LTSSLRHKLPAQIVKYGISGGAAAATLLAVLAILVELAHVPKTPASVIGFGCAVVVNYNLQHGFVFEQTSGHARYLRRYLAVTACTVALNAGLFWWLSSGLGLFYLASQVVTIAIIVPINFMVNRSFTFAS
jgi:putative flippase GtrA